MMYIYKLFNLRKFILSILRLRYRNQISKAFLNKFLTEIRMSNQQDVRDAKKESSGIFNLLFSGAYLGIGAYFGYQVRFIILC